MMKDKKFLFLVLLSLIIVISVFFRFWRLDLVPPGLYPDVAINGNDALNTLASGEYKVFYPDNNGREGLFMWLITFSFSIFGPSVWSIKVVAALFGIFTVLGIYLLAKELFKKVSGNYELIALASAFFTAISFWHVNFSRLGFRAIMTPFFMVYGFYFLIRGFEKNIVSKNLKWYKKIHNFILSGIFLGLGFYSYISYRFVVLLGIVALIWWLNIYRKQGLKKEFYKSALIALVSIIIVALPIGIYFLNNPGDFFGRAAGVSIFTEKNPALTLAKSIALNLGMFNFYGDSNWRHNYAGRPELLWPVGIFFLIGFILTINNLFVSRKKKDKNLFYVSCFMIAWFFIMLLPCFLSNEGNPHALRAIGTIPVVYMLAGFGAFWFFNKIRGFFKTKIQVMQFYSVLSIFLVVIAYAEFNKYFYDWSGREEVKNAFSVNYVSIGNQLNLLSDNIQKYIIVNNSGVMVNGIPMPAQTPIFIERMAYGKTRTKYMLPDQLENIKNEIDTSKEAIIILMEYDTDLAVKTMYMFPNGDFYTFQGFWVYKVNKIPPVVLPEAGCNCGK